MLNYLLEIIKIPVGVNVTSLRKKKSFKKKITPPPKKNPLFCHFQVECMLEIFIFKEYRSLRWYAKLFMKELYYLKLHENKIESATYIMRI